MEQCFITGHGLVELLNHLETRYSIFTPQKKEKAFHYAHYTQGAPSGSEESGASNEGICLGEIRSCEPLKAFYFSARKTVAVDYESAPQQKNGKPLCLVGVKACDLKSLEVLDGVFMDTDYTDPFYADARKENLIISSDCSTAADTCFCISLHVDPFPRGGFDLSLSEIEGGYIVEIGSEKGAEIVDTQKRLFSSVNQDHLSERERRRERVANEVRDNIRENDIPDQDALDGVIKKNYESDLWREEGETCVECGACNVVCPTCHCFLLYDQQHDGKLKRFRLWDSCLIKDFATVAGGANPRPQLWMRLRNRFEKKFDFFPAVKNLYACTGCGRCIEACPGKIDIRRILKRNVESVPK